MAKKSSYAELEQKVKELEQEVLDLKNIEGTLKEKDKRSQNILQSIEVAAAVYSPDERVIDCNRALLELAGVAKDQLIGRMPSDFVRLFREDGSVIPPEEFPVRQVIDKKQPIKNLVCGFKLGDQKDITWILANAVPIFDHQAELTEIILTYMDLTERKQIEEALQESEQKLRNLIQNIEASIVVYGPDGKVFDYSRAALELSSVVGGQVIGGKARDFVQIVREDGSIIPPEEYPIDQVIRTKQPVKNFICGFERPLENDVAWIIINTTPLFDSAGELSHVISTFTDITELKRMTDMARVNEARYLAIIEDQTEFICRLLLDGTFTFVNNAYCRFLEKSPNELIGRNIVDQVPENNREYVANIIASLSPENPVESHELRVIAPNGDIHWRHWTSRLILNDDGDLIEIQWVGRDITVQKRADEALRANEQFLTAIFDSIQDGITVLDPNLNLIRVNQEMEDRFGKTQPHLQPILGKKCYEVYHGRTKHCPKCAALRALRSGKIEQNEFSFVHKNGKTSIIELYAYPMMDDRGKAVGIVEYSRDITERKRAEEALRESSEKIKLFAYSVTHDLKNPVLGINLLAKALFREYEASLDDKGKNYCDLILKASEELASLVQKINAYIETKEVTLNLELVHLEEIFNTVKTDFSLQFSNRRLTWSQPENLPKIYMDRFSMLRVMRNFMDNALKYGGDELSKIEMKYEKSDKFHIISMRDDGIGLTKEDCKKIFGLFSRSLTSRGTEGMGLGLAIASDLATRHKGRVWAEPGLERGAVFYVSIAKDLR